MFGGRTTPWEQKTKGDIIATMIAFVIIGSIIITGTFSMALRERSLWVTIWCITGASFAAALVAVSIRGGIYELRKRRKDTTQNQEHRPPT
jgi:hypothetical protein